MTARDEAGGAARRPVRVANCSGFYGDRLSAFHEQVTGGDLDVVTGDYLAELTMLILGRDTLKDPSLGYARTFLRQLEGSLGEVLDRGVRVVVNAGGLNPAGLADAVRDLADGLGRGVRVAHVEGDDLRGRADRLGVPGALTANAYLGGFGIARALAADADVVVTGRVTDAALVIGSAAWWHGWGPDDLDPLAGALAAGHVVECGCQATGGNLATFAAHDLGAEPLGFPIAEVASDGSAVITKHEGTGGVVDVDSVTAQLLYEVGSPRYANPDVTLRLDRLRVTQLGPDRVEVSGAVGEPPPPELKVAVNTLGGTRNEATFVLTGLDVERKAALVRQQVEAALADDRPATVEWVLARTDRADADTQQAASALLTCHVRDEDASRVGRRFSSACVELALASYPGFTLTAPPSSGSPFGVYRPAFVPAGDVEHVVVLSDGTREVVPLAERTRPLEPVPAPSPPPPVGGPTVRAPLGLVARARSGDKGGDANVGVWGGTDAVGEWLASLLTPDAVRRLLPEAAELDVEVHRLPNLRAVNVVIHGLLGLGVASSTRFDPQAKGLGEWLRSRHVDVPVTLLDDPAALVPGVPLPDDVPHPDRGAV